MADTKNIVVTFPFLSLLGLMFIAFKLTGVVGWSWWYVLMPFWVPIASILLILIMIFIIMLIMEVLK
jgi:hypothetical protein